MTTRRAFLALAGATPLALIGLGSVAQASDAGTCFNPDSLPASQKSLRKALGFVTPAADPAKTCGGCAFFTATTAPCGKCQLLSGGTVSGPSGCRSWAKKG
jgi:hypothetical protein